MSEENDREMFERLNRMETMVAEQNGKLAVLPELHKTMRMMVYMMFFVILSLLFTLIYGAVGDRGLKAVRETIPHLPASVKRIEAAPWFDDIKAYLAFTNYNKHKQKRRKTLC